MNNQATNDNTRHALSAPMAPVAQQPAHIEEDPGYQEFERLANEQGVQHGDPSKAPWAPENRGIPFDKLLAAHTASRPASTDSGQPERQGDFMQTATGRKFWPLSPRADEVFIEDIAHSLALQCRYAGHCLRFYSVAEHSVLIARHLRDQYGEQTALWALLHDASEAYLVDVPRPVKPYLTGYKDAEANVMAAVCDRFGLSREMPAAVHEADNRIIADELVNLVPMDWHARYAGKELGVHLRYWSPEQAREEFMATFDALTGRVGRVA
ncbi:hypothetical protein [Shinella sp.]|uniref:hypothetical protein n=1 Tax=Shinella sp. TaxID=1870904 RepID=UPI0028A0926A|nr:hypothetical protein [Shinella sp.]